MIDCNAPLLCDEFHAVALLLNSRVDVEVHGHGDGGSQTALAVVSHFPSVLPIASFTRYCLFLGKQAKVLRLHF